MLSVLALHIHRLSKECWSSNYLRVSDSVTRMPVEGGRSRPSGVVDLCRRLGHSWSHLLPDGGPWGHSVQACDYWAGLDPGGGILPGTPGGCLPGLLWIPGTKATCSLCSWTLSAAGLISLPSSEFQVTNKHMYQVFFTLQKDVWG